MAQIINTKKAPNCIGPYEQAIKIGNIVFVSGQIAICPETNLIPETIEEQTYQILKNIENIIHESKLTINNIVKTTIFIKNIQNITQVNTIYRNFFIKKEATLPARSCIEVSNLPKNAKIEIEAIAIYKHHYF